MCRLFGYRSNSLEPVHEALVSERNSLRHQSLEHKDGWGIASYGAKPLPDVARGLGAAHADPEFERVSNQLSAHTVIAHVRLASVGRVMVENAHPFVHEAWTFAHNGTLRDWARHGPALEARIAPDLRSSLRGSTDSERCFYLFLTHLRAVPEGWRSAETVARALVRTIREVSALTDEPDAPPSSMNFMVSNGELLVVTRRHRTLYYTARDANNAAVDAPLRPGMTVRDLIVASEELWGGEPWFPISEDHVMGVDGDMVFRLWPFGELAPP